MKKNILFIDDDPIVLLISKMMLEGLGYNVITAEGGLIGIEMLKTNNIDIILLDLMMADIYGLDVLKYIRKSQKFKNIPVILQTGIKNNKDIDAAYKFSDVYVLSKPYNKDDLKNTLKTIIDSVKTKQLTS